MRQQVSDYVHRIGITLFGVGHGFGIYRLLIGRAVAAAIEAAPVCLRLLRRAVVDLHLLILRRHFAFDFFAYVVQIAAEDLVVGG